MNFELPSHHETGPQSPAEVDRYLSLLEKKVGGVEEKETRDVEFYKEVAKKLREYGIDKIKTDIKKSDKKMKRSEVVDWPDTKSANYLIPYSSMSLKISGKICVINFINNEFIGDYRRNAGWYNPNSHEIFINLVACEDGFKEATDLLKKYYNRDGKIDIYDFISGTIAHEETHKNYNLPLSEEEAYAFLKSSDVEGELAFAGILVNIYDEIIKKDFCLWINKPYKIGDYGTYTIVIDKYVQALNNVMKNAGKQAEFEKAKKLIIDKIKTGWTEINGEKQRKYIEKNGKKIRQGYYRDERGKYKEDEANEDAHKAFAAVLTPDIFKKIIVEYKRLSEVK